MSPGGVIGNRNRLRLYVNSLACGFESRPGHYIEDSSNIFRRLRRRGTPQKFGAASSRSLLKIAKEPVKNIDSTIF